jgi:hypothetical protein
MSGEDSVEAAKARRKAAVPRLWITSGVRSYAAARSASGRRRSDAFASAGGRQAPSDWYRFSPGATISSIRSSVVSGAAQGAVAHGTGA